MILFETLLRDLFVIKDLLQSDNCAEVNYWGFCSNGVLCALEEDFKCRYVELKHAEDSFVSLF